MNPKTKFLLRRTEEHIRYFLHNALLTGYQHIAEKGYDSDVELEEMRDFNRGLESFINKEFI
jgi:hypothetical protein